MPLVSELGYEGFGPDALDIAGAATSPSEDRPNISGVVTSIINHGTVVQVFLGGYNHIVFDHTPFRWLVESEGDLVGRHLTYYLDDETVEVG